VCSSDLTVPVLVDRLTVHGHVEGGLGRGVAAALQHPIVEAHHGAVRGVELIEGHPGRGDDDEFATADADGSCLAGGGGGTGGDGTRDQADVSAFSVEQHETHSLCDRGDLLISSHFGANRARVLGAVRGGGAWWFPSLRRPHNSWRQGCGPGPSCLSYLGRS